MDTVLVVRPTEAQLVLPLAVDEVIDDSDDVLPWLGNGRRPGMGPRSQSSSTSSEQSKLWISFVSFLVYLILGYVSNSHINKCARDEPR